MSSTRVISLDFDCCRPSTLTEALEALGHEGVQILAGGTDLINLIKTNLARPKRLVWVMEIEELHFLKLERGLAIGAAVRLSEIELNREVAGRYPALVQAVGSIGGVQVRNMATLAGNICNASPGADTPPILMALGAEALINGPDGNGRRLPLSEFFLGPKKTVLERGEMLTALQVPEPPAHSGASFRKLARVSLDIAKINCAAYLRREGREIKEARVALGSAAPTPVRAPAVERALLGRKGGEGLFREAAALVGQDLVPIDDVRSTSAYRSRVASVLVREALEEAWKRAGSGPGGE